MFSGTFARFMAKPSSIFTAYLAERSPASFLAQRANLSDNLPKRTSSTNSPSLSRHANPVVRRVSGALSYLLEVQVKQTSRWLPNRKA